MLIRTDSSPPTFSNRRCRDCGLEVEPVGTRRWVLNGLLPLGATARYECAVCANIFEVRSGWHVLVLVAALSLSLYSFERLWDESLPVLLFGLLVIGYLIYAIATDIWDRLRNPEWPHSEPGT